MTAQDATPRTDGTIQTGDLLAVAYTRGDADRHLRHRGSPPARHGSPFPASCRTTGSPAASATRSRGCRRPCRTARRPATGPFGNIIDCDTRPEVCVHASLVDADGTPFGMAVEDRLRPYDGHCPSMWEDGKPVRQPADMLDFLDTQPGPADYTFTSEPQVLGWDAADWNIGDLNFGFNRMVHLEVPSWVEACARLEIGIPPVGHWYEMAPGPCPTWDIRIPAQSAGFPGEASGYVAVGYMVGGQYADVMARQQLDTAEQDLDGAFASTLPALMPLTPAVEYLDGAAEHLGARLPAPRVGARTDRLHADPRQPGEPGRAHRHRAIRDERAQLPLLGSRLRPREHHRRLRLPRPLQRHGRVPRRGRAARPRGPVRVGVRPAPSAVPAAAGRGDPQRHGDAGRRRYGRPDGGPRRRLRRPGRSCPSPPCPRPPRPAPPRGRGT